jgi:hypothetical protein
MVGDWRSRLKMYNIIMREFLMNVSGSYPEDLEAKWANQCWVCHKKSGEVDLDRVVCNLALYCGKKCQKEKCKKEDTVELKKCATCKFAFYCGKKCQREDWKKHKLLDTEVKFRKRFITL